MKKPLAIALGACVLTIAVLVAGLVYGASDKKGETLKYSVVFNSGSIESKIVGKHYNEITKRYLPPTEVTQGRKRGTFTAKYDRLRVFTKGDSHVINGMTVNFKDSVATALTLDSPSEKSTMDAKVINLNPLTFSLIDAEIGTREVTSDDRAKLWEIPLLLVILLVFAAVMGAGWIFLVSPLVVLCRRLGAFGKVLSIIVLAAAAWMWYPFVAYCQDAVGLYLVVGILALVFLPRLLSDRDKPVSAKPRPASSSGSPDSYGGVTYDKRYRHLENLVKLVFFISIPWEDFMADYRPLLRTIAGRLGVSSNELERMIGRCSPSDPDDPESRSIHIEVVVPWGYLKKEYAEDFVRIIACRDTMLTPSAIDFLFDVMDSYGLSRSDFLARVNEIGRREFGGRQIRACELADLKGWYDVRKS